MADMTVSELKAQLDAACIDYPAKATKAQLVELLHVTSDAADSADLATDEEGTEVVEESTADEDTAGELMQVVVQRRFRDRYTGDIYDVGQVLGVTEARFDEMNLGKTRVVRA